MTWVAWAPCGNIGIQLGPADQRRPDAQTRHAALRCLAHIDERIENSGSQAEALRMASSIVSEIRPCKNVYPLHRSVRCQSCHGGSFHDEECMALACQRRLALARTSHASQTKSNPSMNASAFSAVNPSGNAPPRSRIHFGNGACNGHRFRHAQMVHTGLNAIQVGQLEHVKSANFNLPHVRSMTNVMANALPTESPAMPTHLAARMSCSSEVILLRLRLVRTAMNATGQQTHPRLAPREPGPCAECLPACFANLALNSLGQGVRLLAQGRRFRHQPLHQLFLEGVDDFAFPVTHGFFTRRAFCTVFQPVEYRLRSE